MTFPQDDDERNPDWVVDPNEPQPPRRTDARLTIAAESIRVAQAEVQEIIGLMNFVEDLIRDCAAAGMTRDDIAEQCSLSTETVDRVLAGGTVLELGPATTD